MEAAERLEAGMVWVNNPLIDNDALPFGGWKASGLGRELGRQGLDAFRRSKMVVIDHKPAIQDWWYPYPDTGSARPAGASTSERPGSYASRGWGRRNNAVAACGRKRRRRPPLDPSDGAARRAIAHGRKRIARG